MTFDVEFQVNPMTLDAEMGEIYDVTGDEYDRGYAAGEQAGYATGRQEGYSEGEAAGYESGQADEQAATDSIIDRSISGAYRNDRVTSIGAHGFYNCDSLTSVDFQRVVGISSSAFFGCTALASADFLVLTGISSGAFSNCTSLTAIVLRENRVCTLAGNSAFTGTPIASGTGYIYVPDDLVDSYKSATNWSTYAAQIRPLSELET